MVSFVKLKTECYTQPHRLVHFSPQPQSVPAALDRYTFSPKLTRPRNIFKIFSWFLRGTANDFFYHDKRSFTSGVLVKKRLSEITFTKLNYVHLFINKTQQQKYLHFFTLYWHCWHCVCALPSNLNIQLCLNYTTE